MVDECKPLMLGVMNQVKLLIQQNQGQARGLL
jgi:hypothetical protein